MKMERITLTDDAKTVLRLIAVGATGCPKTMNFSGFNRGAIELQRNGLAICHQEENGNVEAVRITDYGRDYLASNPRLNNSFDWKWVSLAIMWFIVAAAYIITLITK